MNRGSGLHIFVLIDALGWRLLQGRDFLRDLLPYRVPLRTVLGYSSGAIPTILSGLPPAQTGHWNLFYYDPHGSPFRWMRPFLFLPDWMLDSPISRKALKEIGRRILGLGPSFECCVSPRILSWFNWVERRNLYAPEGILGAPSIFDRMKERGMTYCAYSYREMNDAQILDQAARDVETKKASFYFLYLSEMDMFLHTHRGDNQKLEQKLWWYERELRKLFIVAGKRDPRVSFTVLSDHGMTAVKNHYDLVGDVERLGFRMPHDYLAVYDSTMARFWFFNEFARKSIIEKLTSISCGRILDSNELDQLGVYFPDQRYGEVIFLLHPGWLLSRSDFNGHGWSPVGMHGYHPDDPFSDAIFLSSKEPRMTVHSIGDVFECMEAAVIEP